MEFIDIYRYIYIYIYICIAVRLCGPNCEIVAPPLLTMPGAEKKAEDLLAEIEEAMFLLLAILIHSSDDRHSSDNNINIGILASLLSPYAMCSTGEESEEDEDEAEDQEDEESEEETADDEESEEEEVQKKPAANTVMKKPSAKDLLHT